MSKGSNGFINTTSKIIGKKTNNTCSVGCSTLCIIVIFIFALFVMGTGAYNNQKIVVVSPPAAVPASPPLPQVSVPITVPTRCWGGSCGGIGINPDLRNTRDIFNDPYIPPVKNNDYTYKQIGILTADNSLILPLLGRQHINGRDKWNYYTISNTGSLNTKLPIRVRGKICTNEYGCDEIFNGDIVHVDGYDRKFKASVYENNTYNYDPYL